MPQRGQFLGGTFVADVAIKVDAQELRLASTDAGPLQWTIGVYARDARRRDKLEVGNFAVDNVDATNSRARALFGEATYTLPSAPVDLTAGLRYFGERLTGFEINSGVSIPDPGATYESWNPRFSMAWHPIVNSTLYVSAAKGFRSGQLQPLLAVELGLFGLDLPPSVGQDWI